MKTYRGREHTYSLHLSKKRASIAPRKRTATQEVIKTKNHVSSTDEVSKI